MANPIICQFRARVREIDGTRYVEVPALKPSHVIQGEKIDYTAASLTQAAEMLRLAQGMRRIDSPRLEHVSGDYMGTFRINLGTRKEQRAAREARQAVLSEPWDSSRERLGEYEDRAYRAGLAAFD